jgi:hypothetical protein
MERELKYARIAICSFSIFFIANIFLYEGSCYLNGDGLRHYLVSRWCWHHPDLLLYHWGKPFFTLVSSPFSQFGHGGIQLFNILASAIGVWYLFRLTQAQNIRNAWLVVPFAYVATGFFLVINTGLTEPLFFCLIAVCAWLAYKEKYFLTAVIISFLPFVRSEGNMLLLLFAFLFFIRKKYLHIPLLAAGTLIYSFVGYFHYHDLLWVFTKNPYDGKNIDIYGHGDLLNFVNKYQSVIGNPLAVFLIIALAANAYFLTKKKPDSSTWNNESIILLFGSFCIYFIAHSIFWWKGLYNSLGLTRVMGGVVALLVPLCVQGFNTIFYGHKSPVYKTFWITVSTFFLLYEPIRLKYYPYRLEKEDAVMQDVITWLKENKLNKRYCYYLNPMIATGLGLDPFDASKATELWGLYPSINQWGYGVVPVSSIIVYDMHFGPNEAHIPLDTILSDKNFKLLKNFKPEKPFSVLGGYDFAVYVFQKAKI